jgi:PilZ domain-containing protein
MVRSGPDSKEQRKTRRIEPYLAPCHVRLGRRRVSGYVTNLSPRGARVYTDERPPRVGQAMVIEIRFRARSAFHRLPAEARWVRTASDITGLHSFGVSFKGLKPEERRTVESVIVEFRERAARLLEVAR